MARPDARSQFERVRSAPSPAQRRAGVGTASSTGDVAMRKPVRITVDLSDELHRKLRQRVLDERTSVQSWVRALIDQALRSD